jgi:peptide/nickel transport system permease protein
MRRWRRFLTFAPNWLALFLVSAFLAVALAAPLLAPPDDPAHPSPSKLVEGCFASTPLPPSRAQPLGTVVHYATTVTGPNILHFDVFYSLVWGTRAVLRFGLITALSAALLGTIVGAVSGYLGGAFKTVAMRLTDAFLAFPLIAGVWLFRTMMQTANLELVDYNNFVPVKVSGTPFQQLVLALDIDPVMLTLILFSWMPFARIISANVTVLKRTEYIQAAHVVGARPLRIIFRHLLPNAIAPAIVLLARDIGGMVIMQTAFAFIGVSGTVNSTAIPEWSRLLMLGRHWIIGQGGNPLTYWWLYLPVTLALILFGIAWNLLGDGLNMVLNPRTRAHFTM